MTEPDRTQIICDYDLPAPPAKVWRALTEPALIAKWLMPTDLVPEVGRAFTFQGPAMPGWDGVVQCKILIADAPAKLSYAWRGGPPPPIDTVVTWTLTASADGGTRLHLAHTGFDPSRPGDRMAYDGIARGWLGPMHARIAAALAGL